MSGRPPPGARPSREAPPSALPFVQSEARPERNAAPAHLLGSTDEFDKPPFVTHDSDYSLPPLPQVQFAAGAGPSRGGDGGGGVGADGMRRKKSLVRPDRARNDPAHPLFNYRNHAAAMEADGTGHVGLSTTGAFPATTATGFATAGGATDLRRGQSILAREEGMAHESGLTILARGATLKRRSGRSGQSEDARARRREQAQSGKASVLSPWMIYCRAITICFPAPILRCVGMQTADRQRAWREKIGILSIVLAFMFGVGFLTFGCASAEPRMR